MRHPSIDRATASFSLSHTLSLSPARLARALCLAGAMFVVPGSAACDGASGAPSALDRTETLARFADIPQQGIFLGDPAAPVTLTVFVDLQCPFCRAFTRQVEPSLVDGYVRTGKLRLVLRNLAFLGSESSAAARMGGAVGLQDHLWEFTTLVFASTHHENAGEITDELLRRIAGAIPHVDVDRAGADSGSTAVTEQIEAARQEARRFGIHAAPTFLLGRRGETPTVFAPNPISPESFARAIDALLPPA
jgi:protein-disulfide isomerase